MGDDMIKTETSTETEQKLWVAAVERGDESAFADLYLRHRPMALRIARGICGDEAEDAVQAAFLSIWTSRRRYDPSKGTIRSWMLTVVRNRSIDLVRMPRRHREAASEPSEIDLVDPTRTDELVTEQETARTLRAAVASLPDGQRTVVKLGYFDELSQAEIASRLQLPLGTVKGRARAALKSLRPVAAAA